MRAIVRGFARAIVAFSGGVDSSVLLRVATEENPGRVRAVLCVGPSLPERDRQDALSLAAATGVPLELVQTSEFEDERYVRNGPDRCFWCRSALVAALRPMAERDGAVVLYGPVVDDLEDDRPGMRAAAEGGFVAPLLEAGLTKADVRVLARRLGLAVWDKPASACLSSRVQPGLRITEERLARIDRAETAVRRLGFLVVRVRDHGDLARLELDAGELDRLADPELRQRLTEAIKEAGFHRVTVDLEGYRPAGRTS